MRKIPIVFAIDERVEIPAGVAIFSLLSNASKDTFYDIFILHSDKINFTDSKITAVIKQFENCRLTFRPAINDFEKAFETRDITAPCYYRLLIPEMIPEYDRVIYSDVDVIFREDLSKYYELPLDDYYFAGVNSIPAMTEDDMSYIKMNGFNTTDGYFYTGNLVVNSEKLRTDGMIDIFRNHREKKYRFQDMDIINLTCRGRIKPISPSFCLTNYYYEAFVTERARMKGFYLDEDIEYALKYGTVHFNGSKPWKKACLNMDIWWDYYRKTIFFDEYFAYNFWFNQTYHDEKMPLLKRIKLVGRYFRKGGRR